MTDNFLIRANRLLNEFNERKQLLTDQIDTYEADLHRITSGINELERQRLATSRQIFQTKQALNSFEIDEQEETLDLITREFNNFNQSAEIYIEQNLEVREELQQQLDKLLSQDFALKREFDEYKNYISKKEIIFQHIPDYYRNTVENAIQIHTDRLQPCLDLEEMIQNLSRSSEILIPIVFVFDEKLSKMFWILPIALEAEIQNKKIVQRMDELENSFLHCISLLSENPEWTILDLDRDAWLGFRVLTTVIEYTGANEIAGTIQEYLQQKLPILWPFQNLSPIPQLVQINWQTWIYGQRQNAPQPGIIINFVQPEIDTINVASLPEKPAPSFFTEKDIVAWQRPLRVAEGSSWSVTARRLKTFLARMAIQGRIDNDGISIEQLMDGLAIEHKSSLMKLFPELIKNGIIKQDSQGVDEKIFLNSEYLNDIQDFINREITSFWEPFIK